MIGNRDANLNSTTSNEATRSRSTPEHIGTAYQFATSAMHRSTINMTGTLFDPRTVAVLKHEAFGILADQFSDDSAWFALCIAGFHWSSSAA